MNILRLLLPTYLLAASLSLGAQSAIEFKNLSPGTPACPRQSGSSGAHTSLAMRATVDSAPEREFPKGQRPSLSDFGVLDLEGHLTKVSDLKGHIVIIGVWSTLCEASSNQLYELYQIQKRAAEQKYDLTILAVHLESWPQVLSYLRSRSKYFEGMKVSKAALAPNGLSNLGAEIQALPALYILDRNGNLAATWEGYVPNRLILKFNKLYNER